MPTGLRVDLAKARRSLGLGIWTILLIADLVLAARGFAGEFQFPPPTILAVFSTIIVAVTASVAIRCHSAGPKQSSGWHRSVPSVISIALTLMWAVSVSLTAAPLTIGLVLAVVLVQALTLGFQELGTGLVLDLVQQTTLNRPLLESSQPNSSPLEPATLPVKVSVPLTAGPPDLESRIADADIASDSSETENAAAESEAEFLDEVDDENQTLWLARRQTAVGEEIEGWTRVHFASGQREATVHVAFCPPLAGSPELHTEDLDGAELEIRVAAVFPFGARLAVRRKGDLNERHLDRIGFIAVTPAAPRAA